MSHAKDSFYKDPRWQNRRWEILGRDKETCRGCGAKSGDIRKGAPITLHVHHIAYRGPNLWDTPADLLQTLCMDCHHALGPHPKGGVYWDGQSFCWIHCPLCGSREMIHRGGHDQCARCGHRILPDSWIQHRDPDWEPVETISVPAALRYVDAMDDQWRVQP
jgi:hypothetical protein